MFSNLPFPSLFVCFLIFVLWLHYEKRKSNRKEAQASREFWKREDEANRTRNKDISQLPLFHLEKEAVPLPETDDENTIYNQKQVLESLKQPMMDLSQYTNTDLKLAYGVGNFKTLSDYDENFNDFLKNMSNLGNSYYKINLYAEAETIFRLCLDNGSRKNSDFKALARVYTATNRPDELLRLIEEVEHSDLPRKSALVEELKQLQK